MSTSSLTVIAPDAKRATVKVNSGTPMFKVREEACNKLKLNPQNYSLKHAKHGVIHLNEQFQFYTGKLVAGAKLELVVKSKTTSVVNIALRLPEPEARDIPGGRLTDKFRTDTTLWKMLRHFEAKGAPSGKTLNFTDRGVPQTSNGTQAGSGQLYYEMPVLRIMTREISTLADFQKTLSQVDLDAGSHMIQLSFKSTEQTLGDAMNEISQFFKDEEDLQGAASEPAPALDKPVSAISEPSASTDRIETEAPQTQDLEKSTKDKVTQELPTSQPADDVGDAMDVDESAASPRDVLNPVGIFSAPTNATPVAASIDLPDHYYTPTIAHAQAHQQKLQESAVNRRLKSDAELQAEAQAEEAKIAAVKTVTIKVRFPDQTSAHWKFGPDDTGATLYKAVRSVMANASAPFKLVLPGPPTVSSHIKDEAGVKHTLIKGYRLSGSVLLNLAWEDRVPQEVKKSSFLKPEFASQAAKVEVPDIPVVDEPDTSVPQAAPPKPQASGESSGSAKKVPKWLKGLGGKK
ncbi:hypothetical protein N0V93_001245 [Gnomoniopsis smithogilvyi]|uniref:TUG ubiquitin-like domain-containing protein n=1 Tax=Gnomoniopsis smithogilvyi TaxID=1191159 RepID=A0A9W8Z357_9PEZI|nr:hypothetical protein N0V93_001245 [Gnomoniopsis smithogilvyi]